MGKELQGVQVYFTDYGKARLCDTQFYLLQELYRLYPDHDILQQASNDRKDMFDKVCGSKEIRRLFMQHHRWADARSYWDKDAEAFRRLSQKYYLYK